MFLHSILYPKKEADKKADAYEVVSPIVKDTTYTREYVAEIQSVRYVEVRSKIKGFIEKNYVDEGQSVKKGQLLFTLSFSEFEKELQKANAAMLPKVDLNISGGAQKNAYLEVANQLSNIKNLQVLNKLKKQQSKALKQSVDVSKELYKSALATYLEVLIAQQSALQSNLELINVTKQQRISRIKLYKALGGGWK